MSDEKPRVRWRMTLDELCWRVKASPLELNEWAKLGAFGPAWQETTENKWRHITKAVARRAIVMRHALDLGLEPENAAVIANSVGANGKKAEKVRYGASGTAVIEIDLIALDLP